MPAIPARVLEPHIVPALRNLRAVIRNVSDSPLDEDLKYDLLFRLRNKEDEFMRAGNLLAAISLEVTADPPGRSRRDASSASPRCSPTGRTRKSKMSSWG